MSFEVKAMPLRFAADHIRRITSRGWRSNAVLLFTVFSCAAFILWKINRETDEVLNSGHTGFTVPPISTSPEIPTFREGSTSPALNAILNEIITDSAVLFHPDGKDVRDQDIAYIARQTAIMKDLFNIYAQVPMTNDERESFRSTIHKMQQALYPWITKPNGGRSTYGSLFDLIGSYKEEVGIVISAGREGGFRWAVHQIVTLRAVLNCSLPIEVFYGGNDDLPDNYRQFIRGIELAFPDLGSISTIDVTERFPDPDLGLPGRWASRPFSILASSFKTVILADADTIFLQDPRVMLQEPMYKAHGSVFWHDRLLAPASEDTYKWADEILESAKAKNMDQVHDAGWFRHQTFYEMESGAVVVDKSRNLAGVLMTCYLNTRNVRDAITYKRFYGDKESYWFGHALTSTPYHFVPGYSGGIGRITHPEEDGKENKDKEEICTLQLLHVLESTGEPFWFNNAITEYKGAQDAEYLSVDGWVPHDGRWHGGGKRFPNEFCVEMPYGDRDKTLGLPEHVHRVDAALKWRIDRSIEEAKKYDGMMEKDGLLSIHRETQ